MEIKVRTKEQQAIDNLKTIVNSNDKIIEIEPPLEDCIEIILDYVNKLEKLCDDYEEEHNNEFQCWKRDRKELLDKRKKIDKIDKLINTDYSRVSYYYKYNNRYLKSEIREDINKILGGDDNE